MKYFLIDDQVVSLETSVLAFCAVEGKEITKKEAESFNADKLAKREAAQAEAAIAAKDLADEAEALSELLKEKFGDKLAVRVAEKRAARDGQAKRKK